MHRRPPNHRQSRRNAAGGWVLRRAAIPLLAIVLVFAAVSNRLAEAFSEVSTANATAETVLVVSSYDTEPYREALEGFRRELEARRDGVQVALCAMGGREDASLVDRAVAAAAPRLIFSLGSLATRAATRQKSVPVVYAMVLRGEEFAGTSNATGVFLEFPAEESLKWVRKILPGRDKVGVVFDPAENRSAVEALRRAAKAAKLDLHAEAVDGPSSLPSALENVSRRVDVLLGVADSMVLSPKTAKEILLFSYRNRIPFVGLSNAWVKAGALYALDRDYADLGAQAAEMAAAVLRGAPVAGLPPSPPRKLVYDLNLKTARHLRLEIPAQWIAQAREVIE